MRLNLSRPKVPAPSTEEVQMAKAIKQAEDSDRPKHSDDERRQHEENRKLSTEELLEKLKVESPQAFECSEVVGTWVWTTFPNKPDADTRKKLYLLGFHWNRNRGAGDPEESQHIILPATPKLRKIQKALVTV